MGTHCRLPGQLNKLTLLPPAPCLLQRLRELGFDYGSMPAHNLLWEGCEMSAADLGARLAIVPMSQVGGWLAALLSGWACIGSQVEHICGCPARGAAHLTCCG